MIVKAEVKQGPVVNIVRGFRTVVLVSPDEKVSVDVVLV